MCWNIVPNQNVQGLCCGLGIPTCKGAPLIQSLGMECSPIVTMATLCDSLGMRFCGLCIVTWFSLLLRFSDLLESCCWQLFHVRFSLKFLLLSQLKHDVQLCWSTWTESCVCFGVNWTSTTEDRECELHFQNFIHLEVQCTLDQIVHSDSWVGNPKRRHFDICPCGPFNYVASTLSHLCLTSSGSRRTPLTTFHQDLERKVCWGATSLECRINIVLRKQGKSTWLLGVQVTRDPEI